MNHEKIHKKITKIGENTNSSQTKSRKKHHDMWKSINTKMTPKFEKTPSTISVKFEMIHKKIHTKNHQNWWKYTDWKKLAKLDKNPSPITVNTSMNQQKNMIKNHQNWWKSNGFIRICTNFVENEDGQKCVNQHIMWKLGGKYHFLEGYWSHLVTFDLC